MHVIGPWVVSITAYSNGPTCVTSAPARIWSDRTSITIGVPSNCASDLPLGTSYKIYVPGVASCGHNAKRSTLFSLLNSADPLAGSCFPSKSVSTRAASPSDLTLTVIGCEGGYQTRDGVITEISENNAAANMCMVKLLGDYRRLHISVNRGKSEAGIVNHLKY